MLVLGDTDANGPSYVLISGLVAFVTANLPSWRWLRSARTGRRSIVAIRGNAFARYDSSGLPVEAVV